jgi:hypothetical protein
MTNGVYSQNQYESFRIPFKIFRAQLQKYEPLLGSFLAEVLSRVSGLINKTYNISYDPRLVEYALLTCWFVARHTILRDVITIDVFVTHDQFCISQ